MGAGRRLVCPKSCGKQTLVQCKQTPELRGLLRGLLQECRQTPFHEELQARGDLPV